MSSLIRKTRFLGLGVLLLGACSVFGGQVERIRVERLNATYFLAKSNPAEVELIFQDVREPFISIARIEGQGMPNGSMTLLLEEIQAKAAALGADAIIRVKTGWRIVTTTGYSRELQQDYGLSTPSELTGNTPTSGQQIPWVSGLAVKFDKGVPSHE